MTTSTDQPTLAPRTRPSTFAQAEAVLAQALPGYESRLLALTGLTVEQFMAKYKRQGDCLVWTGSRVSPKRGGYGRVWVPSERRHVLAHRVSYEVHYGPTALHVLHRCDNPPCGDPKHLFAGTDKDNSQDALSKGRLVIPPVRRGEASPTVKFSDEVVDEVVRRHRAGETQLALAAEFGIHQTTISLWARGKSRIEA